MTFFVEYQAKKSELIDTGKWECDANVDFRFDFSYIAICLDLYRNDFTLLTSI